MLRFHPHPSHRRSIGQALLPEVRSLRSLCYDRMIEGVVLRKLKLIPDERGWLMELMRSDRDVFETNEFVGSRLAGCCLSCLFISADRSRETHHLTAA